MNCLIIDQLYAHTLPSVEKEGSLFVTVGLLRDAHWANLFCFNAEFFYCLKYAGCMPI